MGEEAFKSIIKMKLAVMENLFVVFYSNEKVVVSIYSAVKQIVFRTILLFYKCVTIGKTSNQRI